MENKVSVSKNSHGTHISGETSYYINLLKEDALADDVNSVHRFPDIKFHLLQTPVAKTPLMFKLDANFTQFSRENFGYDDVALVGETINSDGDLCENEKCIRENRDGHFDPSKDIIRTGYRFDVAPTLSLPFHLGQFNLVPEIKYRETQYRFNSEKNCSNLTGADLISCEAAIYSPTAERRYLDMTLSAKTVFSKVYGGSNPKGTKYRHEIEPEVTYSTIPWIRRPEHSFFGQFEGQPYSQESEPLSDDDFFGTNKVQFDYNDRVFDRRIVNFALSNKIIRKETIGNLDKYKQIFLFRLSQSFDFNETDTDNPQPWSTINGLLDVRLDHFETYATAIYYPYAQVTNWAGRVKLLDSFGNFVQLRYNRQVLVNENNEIDFENKTSDVSLDTGFVSKFFNLTGFVTYSTVVSEIKQWGYYLQIKPPGNCWNIQLGQTQRLKAPGTLTANISFEFGGGPLK